MARNFSPRKRRNKTVLSPQQSIIRSYFTPRNGITKEDVNFLVKPVKEPKFKRPASEMTRDSDGICGQLDQITSPLFTTAAKVHEQASKWCKSGTIKGEFLLSQPDVECRSCKSSASSPNPWDVHSQRCTEKNSFSDDSAYFSSGRKQTHINARARVLPLMASSSSSTSSSSRKVKRAQNRQNHRNIKTEKRHKQTTLISLLDSEDGENSSDSDCCIVKHVVRKNKTPLSDSDVEEISSCSQTSSSGSSQSSQTSVKRKTASSSASQTSDSSESSRSSSTKSTYTEPSKSAKSSRRPKKQSSASSSMYGLVGDDVSESEDDSEDLSHCGTEFSQLPVEIMENIFCQLPIIDLMLNCVLVCRQWNSIISRDSVMTKCSNN